MLLIRPSSQEPATSPRSPTTPPASEPAPCAHTPSRPARPSPPAPPSRPKRVRQPSQPQTSLRHSRRPRKPPGPGHGAVATSFEPWTAPPPPPGPPDQCPSPLPPRSPPGRSPPPHSCDPRDRTTATARGSRHRPSSEPGPPRSAKNRPPGPFANNLTRTPSMPGRPDSDSEAPPPPGPPPCTPRLTTGKPIRWPQARTASGVPPRECQPEREGPPQRHERRPPSSPTTIQPVGPNRLHRRHTYRHRRRRHQHQPPSSTQSTAPRPLQISAGRGYCMTQPPVQASGIGADGGSW